MNYLFLVLTSFFTCADHGEFTFRGQDYAFTVEDHRGEEDDESPAFYVSISWEDDYPGNDDSGARVTGLPTPELQTIFVYMEMVEEGVLHIYGFVRQDPVYEVFIVDPNNPQRWASRGHEFIFSHEGVGIDGENPVVFPKLNVKTVRL